MEFKIKRTGPEDQDGPAYVWLVYDHRSGEVRIIAKPLSEACIKELTEEDREIQQYAGVFDASLQWRGYSTGRKADMDVLLTLLKCAVDYVGGVQRALSEVVSMVGGAHGWDRV